MPYLYLSVQVKARPPSFAAFVTGSEEVSTNAARFLANFIRTSLGFEGLPIRIMYRYKKMGDGARRQSKAKQRQAGSQRRGSIDYKSQRFSRDSQHSQPQQMRPGQQNAASIKRRGQGDSNDKWGISQAFRGAFPLGGRTAAHGWRGSQRPRAEARSTRSK